MSSNLTMIDTNFADDQVGQTNFIAFSDTMNTADTNVNSVDSNIDKSKVCNSDDISATDDAASNADTGNTDENIPSEVHDNETEVKVSVTNDKLTENETPLQGNIDKSNLNAVKSTKEASESSDKLSECTEASSKPETVSTDLLENVIKSEGSPADVDSSNSIEKITENLPVDLIEKIINTEGLDGTIEKNPVENSITETQKQAEETHASGSVKIEEIKVTETDQLDETNIETVENHVKETTGGENQGVVQDDDEGDGMLYIDEGNANPEGNNNPDDDKPKEETKPDSDDEEKDKDSSDSDTSVEEEEDEDEKVFGENIKEKKRSVIKKAKDESRPAEKIDIEAFKNEWSDEEGDDADVDMKDTSTTKQQKSEALNDGKSKPKDAVINDTTAAVTNATSTVTNDTSAVTNDTSAVTNDTPTQQETVHIEPDKTKDTLQQQQEVAHIENDIVADSNTTSAKKTPRKLERTIYDSNGEVIVKKYDDPPPNAAEPVETSDTGDTPGNTASNANSVADTSDNSGKSNDSLDENMDESMLIEEISGDGEVEGDGEVLTEEMEVTRQEEETTQEEEGQVVMGGEGEEEAIVVIGGANGENLEDFVIVNENNEEQEIFEEIAEDGTKTYYLKVKPSATVEQTKESDRTEEERDSVQTEGTEQAPLESGSSETTEDTLPAEPGTDSAAGRLTPQQTTPIKRGKKKGLMHSPLARQIALQQIEQFQLQKVEKAALVAAKVAQGWVKPSAGPPLGKRPTPNVDDISVPIQLKVDPPASEAKSQLEHKYNLSRDKLERTVQLAQEEKRQKKELELKRKELARSLMESLPSGTITAPPAKVTPTQTAKATAAQTAKVAPAQTKAQPVKISTTVKTASSPMKKPSRPSPSVQGGQVVSVPQSVANSGSAANTTPSVAGVGGGDATPSRKSTRIKIENQTLKDYAVDLPESYSTVYTAASTVTLSRTPSKAGRPSKRKLAEGLQLGADSKRFMISYANSRKRAAGLDEDDTANPVIPPLIIQNGKEIVDLMLSGDKRSTRRVRGTTSVETEENLVIVESKKKKPNEIEPDLELELDNNNSAPTETHTSNEDSRPTEDPLPANTPAADNPTVPTTRTTTNDTTSSTISATTTTPVTTTATKKSPVKTASPRSTLSTARTNTRGSVKATSTTTTLVSDQQVLVDVKGMKAKIPANTWNVTSELEEEDEQEEMETTSEGEQDIVEKKPKNQGKLSTTPLQSKTVLSEQEKKRQNKMMREINQLLGDEGAINMLYSVTQKRNRGNDNVMDSPVSNKKMKKNLLMKTKLVKSAVLNLSNNSEDAGSESPSPGRLRKSSSSALNKANTPPVTNRRKGSGGLKKSKSRARQISLDSVRSSLSSSEHPVKSPSVAFAESVIFRRHSSDSSEGEEEEGEEEEVEGGEEEEVEEEEEDGETDGQQSTPAAATVTPPDPRRLKHTIRSNLIKLTTPKPRPPTNNTAGQITPASTSSPGPRLPYVLNSTGLAATTPGTKQQQSNTSARATVSGTSTPSASTSVIEEVEQELESLFGGGEEEEKKGEGEKEASGESAAGKAEEKVTEESEPSSSSSVPVPEPTSSTISTPSATKNTTSATKNSTSATKNTTNTPAQTQAPAKTSTGKKKNRKSVAQKQQETPVADSTSSVRQKSTRKSALKQKQQEIEPETETIEQQQQQEENFIQQTSSNAERAAQQDEVNVISVKICDDLAYISFLNTTQHNYLTVNILNELTATLVYLDRQDACKTILMMGAGFGSGVDLTHLLCDNRNKRRRNATSMAKALKEFITTLAQLGKPILLGVSGAVVGAAVTILPLFDYVLASNSATFETLYHKLGQIPECAATFTFPLFLGRNATSELLMSCKKISSQEAKSLNLITRVCSQESFEKNAEMWAKEISKYSAQSMQTTKLLLRKDLYSQLNETLSTETDFLIEHWTSEEVQKNLKKHLMNV